METYKIIETLETLADNSRHDPYLEAAYQTMVAKVREMEEQLETLPELEEQIETLENEFSDLGHELNEANSRIADLEKQLEAAMQKTLSV